MTRYEIILVLYSDKCNVGGLNLLYNEIPKFYFTYTDNSYKNCKIYHYFHYHVFYVYFLNCSWGSMIGKVTRLLSGQSGVQMPTGARNSSPLEKYRLVLCLTQAPI